MTRKAPPKSSKPPVGYVLIPAGSFLMGSPESEADRWPFEGPQHRVEITRGFWMKTTPVTTGAWHAVVGNRPSRAAKSCGDDCPVERVNWFEALAYANTLSEREGLGPCYALEDCSGTLGAGKTYRCKGAKVKSRCLDDSDLGAYRCSTVELKKSCTGYRLPTEAEWEYAYRAGAAGAYYGPVDEIAWHRGNSGRRVQPVAQKKANAWGLHDMAGGVYEWVWDAYERHTAEGHTDSEEYVLGSYRVLRGGSWLAPAKAVRAAARHNSAPRRRGDDIGFRLVRARP